MSRTIQFRRLGTATLANTTGANGELIINSTNKTLTVHDGTTPGGFVVTGNTSTNIDQVARNTANTATSNITILQGVNTTQNTNITSATNLAQAAFNYANTLTVSSIDQYARNEANAAVIASTSSLNENIVLRGVNDAQNTRISLIEDADTTQNTNINNAINLAQAAFNQANTGGGLTANSVATLSNKTFDVSVGSNNIFSIQGQSITSYSGSGQVVLLQNSPTISVLNLSDSQLSVDGGTGSLYWSGQSGVAQAGDLKAGVYSSDPTSNNSLFTFGGAGANNMSVSVEGSVFIGTAMPSNNGGLNTTYPGWLIVQSGAKFGGTINTLGALQFDDPNTGKIIFTDSTEQTTAYQNIVWQTANSAANLAQAAFDAANTANGGGVTGNISIVSTNSAINFVANSSGDNQGYSTIELVPDTNTTQDQYIVIDPTAPSHIHIRAGGTQDSSSAELYLGGERKYVRVVDGSGIRIQEQNDVDDIYYYNDPTDYTSGTWYEFEGSYYVQFTTTNPTMGGHAFDFTNNTDLNELTVYYDGGSTSNVLTSAGSASNLGGGTYRVGVNQAPQSNNTVLTSMDFRLFTTNTNYIRLENSDFEVSVRDDIRMYGRDTFRLMNYSSTDPIEIYTDYDDQEYRWEFGADGNLTTPGDVTVSGDVTGTSGASTLYVKAQPAGNTYIQLNENVDSVVGTMASLVIRTDVANADYQWSFGVYGDFDLPGNLTNATACSAINFVSNSSGDGNGYSTIELRPDTNLSGTDQYLIIDPTAPGHIHIRAGGTQDSSSAELFLGGEESHVKIGAGFNPPVTIKANTYNWDFDVNGDLAAPGKIYLNNGNENALTLDQFGIRANTQMSLSAENFATGNNSSILFDKNGGGIVFRLEDTTPVSKNWGFYQNNLVFPNSSTQTGAAISIVELKALVANCATYGDFQTAIANL